jgi:putative nucleotidyltransferase with HDIG domain
MSDKWGAEKRELAEFSWGVVNGPALPDGPDSLLESHAKKIGHLQNLLSLVASLPVAARPPVCEWDDILGPLWRKLFVKGCDIDRYTLAGIWRPVLLDAGEIDRFLRATTSVAASARNFYHYEEALDCCREGRAAAEERKSAALAYLINTEGFIHACMRNYPAAERCFEEALTMAEVLPEKELMDWGGLSRSDFIGQEQLNLLDMNLDVAYRGQAADVSMLMPKIRKRLKLLEKWPLSPGLLVVLRQNEAQLAVLEEDYGEAKSILGRLYSKPSGTGPYRFSMQAMQCRLLSMTSSRERNWDAAYYWIRKALRDSIQKCYPAEELFVLEQALSVLRGLHGPKSRQDRDELIRDLVQLMEDKDWYTGRPHSRSVSTLAVKLGRQLQKAVGWEEDLEKIRTAGLLHDIGKLMMPWSLLNKIAPITPKERAILAEHASHGGRILREIGMTDVAEIVEQHHETMDGTGYPSGLPPGRAAAIVAVCDAYEAMITPNRRYKEPKSSQRALAEISDQSGRLYHPDVVQALFSTVKDSRAEAREQLGGISP